MNTVTVYVEFVRSDFTRNVEIQFYRATLKHRWRVFAFIGATEMARLLTYPYNTLINNHNTFFPVMFFQVYY